MWVQFGDNFDEEPRLASCRVWARWGWIAAHGWSARNGTDGIIPREVLVRLLFDESGPKPADLLKELCTAGLLVAEGAAFRIDGWLERNPSRAEAAAGDFAALAQRRAAGKSRAAGARRVGGKFASGPPPPAGSSGGVSAGGPAGAPMAGPAGLPAGLPAGGSAGPNSQFPIPKGPVPTAALEREGIPGVEAWEAGSGVGIGDLLELLEERFPRAQVQLAHKVQEWVGRRAPARAIEDSIRELLETAAGHVQDPVGYLHRILARRVPNAHEEDAQRRAAAHREAERGATMLSVGQLLKAAAGMVPGANPNPSNGAIHAPSHRDERAEENGQR